MSHQIAIIVDASKSIKSDAKYWERVKRLLQTFNRPETAKASIYFATDKVVKIVKEGDDSPYIDFALCEDVFDPYADKVSKAVLMNDHNTVVIVSPRAEYTAKAGNPLPNPVQDNSNLGWLPTGEQPVMVGNDVWNTPPSMPKEKVEELKKKFAAYGKKGLISQLDKQYNLISPSVDPQLQALLDEEATIEAENNKHMTAIFNVGSHGEV